MYIYITPLEPIHSHRNDPSTLVEVKKKKLTSQRIKDTFFPF